MNNEIHIQLSQKEINLLLRSSKFDIFEDGSGGPDESWVSCPLCYGRIYDDNLIKEYVQKEHFEQNILPTLSEYMKGHWDSPYHNMRVYHLTQEQKNAIIFPHEEGCEIELLKQLRKKLIKIQE